LLQDTHVSRAPGKGPARACFLHVKAQFVAADERGDRRVPDDRKY
jgi:hypothetical protein